jgi:predicted transcriptional regulator
MLLYIINTQQEGRKNTTYSVMGFSVEIWAKANGRMHNFDLQVFRLHRKGVDMSLKKKKIHILTILFENLQETNPQLVSSTTIAAQINLGLPDLQQVLKSMEGMGLIQSDPDQQFSLITRKGLIWLDQQSSNVYSQTLQQKEKIVSRPRFT